MPASQFDDLLFQAGERRMLRRHVAGDRNLPLVGLLVGRQLGWQLQRGAHGADKGFRLCPGLKNHEKIDIAGRDQIVALFLHETQQFAIGISLHAAGGYSTVTDLARLRG